MTERVCACARVRVCACARVRVCACARGRSSTPRTNPPAWRDVRLRRFLGEPVDDCLPTLGQGVFEDRQQHLWTVAEDVSDRAELADVFGVVDHVRRRGMTQTVRREARNVGFLHEQCEGAVVRAGEDVSTVACRVDQVVVLPVGARDEALFGLLGPAPDQRTNRLGRQRDESPRSHVLGVAEHGAAVDSDEALVDPQRSTTDVEVVPAMRQCGSCEPFVVRPTLASSAWDVRSAARQYVGSLSARALDGDRRPREGWCGRSFAGGLFKIPSKRFADTRQHRPPADGLVSGRSAARWHYTALVGRP